MFVLYDFNPHVSLSKTADDRWEGLGLFSNACSTAVPLMATSHTFLSEPEAAAIPVLQEAPKTLWAQGKHVLNLW